MRIRRRSFGLKFTVLCIVITGILARYWYNVGFDQKYRRLIADELARYGLGAEIGRLTLDPVDGLTARDVELFDLTSPDQHLASINRIMLDIDLARLVNREEFLRSITLIKASLSLPVDPKDHTSEWIRVSDLNSRLIIKGQQIEIAQAEANLSGIHVRVRGDVTRAGDQKKDPEEERRKREQQLREMRDRRGALRSVLRLLDRFRIPHDARGVPAAPHMAQVEVEVHGDLADLDQARVRATMSGGPLNCGDFTARDYSADAVLEDGELTLRRLSIQDAIGTFSASGSWKIRQSDSVDLAVDSSIDLPALLRGVMPELMLPEGLKLHEPPRFRAAGQLYTGRPFQWDRLPLRVTGSLTAGGFAVRGETFTGLHGDFALRPDGFLYLRHLRLSHPSGSLSGQCMRDETGIRYAVDFDGGMSMLTPLTGLPSVKDALTALQWTEQSRLTARLSGHGSADARTWSHEGTAGAREFQFRNALIRQCSGRIRAATGDRPALTVEDFLIRREDGDLAGRRAVIDWKNRLLHLSGVTSGCFPAPAAAMFAPDTGAALTRYFFESPPQLELDGTIGLRSPDGNDLKIKLQSPGACGLPVTGQDWRFTGVAGTLHLKKDLLAIALNGRSAPGQQFSAAHFPDAASMTLEGEFGVTKANAVTATRYTVAVTSPKTMQVHLMDREFPVEKLQASVKQTGTRLRVNATGRLFDGDLTAEVDFPDATRSGHAAGVSIDRVDFQQVTRFFGSGDETGGVITGRFRYETPDGLGRTIEGTGNATLEEGNVFALPLLGPLSGVISSLLPGDRIAYSVARKATATFRASGGTVVTDDFEAQTRTFRLTASGVTDLARDRVDLTARVNLRGAPGLLLYPVSKLFEYSANGTMAKPGWRPKVLNGVRRLSGPESGR